MPIRPLGVLWYLGVPETDMGVVEQNSYLELQSNV